MKKKRWRGVLTLQGVESPDHRILDVVTWRDLPLTLRLQTEDFGAHEGATPVGSIESLQLLPDGRLWGDGPFSESESGELAALWVAERTVRGVSVDPGRVEYREEYVDPATGEVVEMARVVEAWDEIAAAEDEDDSERAAEVHEWISSLYVRVRFELYEVAAATLVATPAFPEASIEVYEVDDEDDAEVRKLAALLSRRGHTYSAGIATMVAGVPAGAVDGLDLPAPARLRQAAAPRTMRAEWYAPQPNPPKKFTITDDGQMLGYLFTWDACHRSFSGRCETPDRQADFPEFHTGEVALDNGERMRVGVLTCAALHAPDGRYSEQQLAELMENTGVQLGPVRLYADDYGVQACGQVFADVDADTVARALAGYPSGDWRMTRGSWRLFGLHVVNTPGFPSYEGVGDEPLRLVASIAPLSAPDAVCPCQTHESAPEPADELSDAHSVASCSCGSSELSRDARLRLLDLDVALLAR